MTIDLHEITIRDLFAEMLNTAQHKVLLIKLLIKLVQKTPQVSRAGYCGYDEIIGPAVKLGDVEDNSVLPVMLLNECCNFLYSFFICIVCHQSPSLK